MKILIFIIFFQFFIYPLTVRSEGILKVVPLPKEYKFTGEKFFLDNSSLQIKKYFEDNESVNIALKEFLLTLKADKNFLSPDKNKSLKQMLIGIAKEDKEFRNICEKNNLLPGAELGDEGYRILIDSTKIIISAGNSKGLFYGIQTLKQIARGCGSAFLPGIKITDWPALNYRVIMDDISRGPVPTVSFIKQQIKRLAELKINFLMHYNENTILTKSHPEFAPADGSISVDEWKRLTNFAQKYNIKLIGSFQSFGHFTNILKTPEYAYLGESGTLISPEKPESYAFLKDIYSEMVPAFSAPFFNINCDETFDLGKGASKKLVDSLGYAEVYYRHIMKLRNILKKLNAKTMIWGDVLLQYPELLKKLPKDIIVATWAYDDLPSYSKYIDPIKEAGFEYLVASGTLNSDKIFPDYRQTFGNIDGFAEAASSNGALGMINTVWDDGGIALFSNDWYGISYSADKSWNPETQEPTYFDKRFNAGIYGATDNNYTCAINKICQLADLEPTDGMTDRVLFEKILPDPGKQIRISAADWQKVTDIAGEAIEYLKNCDLGNYSRDKEYVNFVCELYKSLAVERINIIKIAKYYSGIDSLIARKPDEARKIILESVCLLNRLSKNENVLKSVYEKLWLTENHTYALQKVTGNFEKRYYSLNYVKDRLMESLKCFDSRLPILSQQDAGLAVSELSGKYFREWLAINPLPNKDGKPVSDIDYLSSIGGENFAVPKVTQEFYFDSVKYRWTRITGGYEDIVNLDEIFPLSSHKKVIYAFATIESNKDTSVNALIGFNEGLELFLNGEKIFKKESPGNLEPDKYFLPVMFHKGINNLMLKISSISGDCGFTFKLKGCSVRNQKNRYKINFL